MSNILSQNEVDSLLDVIGDGKVETETDAREEPASAKPYDFNAQTGPGNLRLPALGIINERSVSYLRSSLSAVTRTNVDVALSGMESAKFGEFCRGLPLPSSLNIFKINPLRGYALLVIDGRLVFAFVDTFFGGRGGTHVKLEGRGFTTIENKIVQKIVRIILSDLQRAWADIHPVEMAHERSEMDPQFASIVSANDMAVVVRFKVDLHNAAGSIALCIPFSTIEPIREQLQSSYKSGRFEADMRWRRYLERKIREAAVTLGCRLGSAQISGRDLQKLKVGDVIALDQREDGPITLRVEGVPLFTGYPGANNSNRAIRIDARITEE